MVRYKNMQQALSECKKGLYTLEEFFALILSRIHIRFHSYFMYYYKADCTYLAIHLINYHTSKLSSASIHICIVPSR